MAQKHGVKLFKTSAFQNARVYLSDFSRDCAQQSKVDSVLTWSNILFFLKVVDLSSKWESLKWMHILRKPSSLWFSVLQKIIKANVLNNERIFESIVFGVKSAPAVGTKGAVINMIMNRCLTFPFVDMTWLDSDGKYILCWVSILEIITMFRTKPSYLKTWY